MDFQISEEQKNFVKNVRDVLNNSVKPQLKTWYDEDIKQPEMFRMLGEAGLLGFTHEYENVEPIPWQQNIYYYREAARISGGVAIASFAHSQLGCHAFHLFGSQTQQSKYLIPGAEGKKIIAFANTEPSAGSDASAIEISARKDGDGYLVNGTKAYITNGDLCHDIVFTAVTHPEAEKPHRGISMFTIESNAEGLERTHIKKFGWSPSHIAVLKFKDVKVPKENLIGEPQRGFYQTMQIFNASRIGLSALALGTALASYEQAYGHARKRQLFGKALIEHTSKRNEFAEHIAQLEAGWLLVQKAAYLKDSGMEFRFNSSMAKLLCTEEGQRIAQWAATCFGARGILASHKITEYPMDAQAALIGEGAPEVQKKIIGENIETILNSFE
jgi:alkylation response protein AidB-like acyl-CoA dehydrogenase